MRLFKIALFIVAVILSVVACSSKNNQYVGYDNQNIAFEGRIDSSGLDGVNLYWSGTSIKLNFEGTSIEALLKDNRGDNYYNIIVDNQEPIILRPDTNKRYHKLAENLSAGKHSVELFKRTEWDRGSTTFYGFKLDDKAKVLPKSSAKKRSIEFYGNSITAGYAVEDLSGNDSPDSTFTNNYLSYANLTAKHFDAKYHCTCKSGIGIMVSWFPTIMPEIYNRINPEDSLSIWNFSLYQPDIVVVNLFQNDSWLVHRPNHESFKARFGRAAPTERFIINAYQDFIGKIRSHYPESEIICILGNMDITREGSKWPDYINKAVASFNDDKIYTNFVPFKDSPGHPTIKEQEDIANSLIGFIEKEINW